MTLLIPNILPISFKTFITFMNTTAWITEYIEQDLPVETLFYLGWHVSSFPFFASIVLALHLFTHGILSIPIYFWTLLWHPNGWSILEMLPDLAESKRLIPYDKSENCHCWQERARSVPCWARHKCHSWFWFQWSKTNTDISTICGYDSRLGMFSFYQIRRTSINKTDREFLIWGWCYFGYRCRNKTSSHWVSSFLSGATLLWRGCPKRLTNGIISAFLIFITVVSIFRILTGAWHAIIFWPQVNGLLLLLSYLAREMSVAALPRQIP